MPDPKTKDDSSSDDSDTDTDSSTDTSDYSSDSSVPSDPELRAIMGDMDGDVDPDDLPNQSNQRSRKMKNMMKQWGIGSSCHGVPHMAEAHTKLVVIIWTIILVICFGAFCWLFSDTLIQYLKYDKIVQLKMGQSAHMNFPAVTFCNINPYKLSKISSVPELDALITVYKRTSEGNSL